MEPFVIKSYLYDFYGELLTEHQRRIYEEINFNDYSAAEVARDEGISRQGVHDLMKRCDRLLEDYEERLHLVARFIRIRDKVRRIESLTDSAEAAADGCGMPEDFEGGSGRPGIPADPRMREIRELSRSILEEL